MQVNYTAIDGDKTVKLTTDQSHLLFIGVKDDEEYYLDMNSNFKGWSFMGLRPETEDTLRERQRDIEPSEYATIPDFLMNYFDYDKWESDMEDQWEEAHDVQATRIDDNGATLYLGSGSGQDIYHYFAKNKITSFDTYLTHFEYVGLTKKEFKELMKKLSLKITDK